MQFVVLATVLAKRVASYQPRETKKLRATGLTPDVHGAILT